MADVETLTRIEDVLERIRPALHADGGDVEIVDFDDEWFGHLPMLGPCSCFPMNTGILPPVPYTHPTPPTHSTTHFSMSSGAFTNNP